MRAAPWPFGNQEHADLLAGIGEALGLDGPLLEWRAGSYTGAPDPSDRKAPQGGANQVLTGFAETGTGRVVWVEEHTGDLRDPEAAHYPEDFVDVMVNVAGPGARHLPRIGQPAWIKRPGSPWISVALDDDRPDRVRGIPYLRFFGDELMVVYGKGLGRVACRFTFRQAPAAGDRVLADRLWAGQECVVAEAAGRAMLVSQESVIRLGYSPLVHVVRLPDFAPEVPLPVPELSGEQYARVELHASPEGGVVHWAEKLREGSGWRDGRMARLRLPGPSQAGFPRDPAAVWEELRSLLAGPHTPPDGPDILIGAITPPFWDAYSGSADRTSTRRPRAAPTTVAGPFWFPAAWHRYLRSPEGEEGAAQERQAAAWLSWLELLAAQHGRQAYAGWDPGWSRHDGAAQLALTHIRQRCRVLAAACRANELPAKSTYVDPGMDLLYPRPLTAFPAGFARAWNRLPARFRLGGPAANPRPVDQYQ